MDARPTGRFDGTAPEPNPKLRSGHVLGTTNVPFYDFIDAQSKTLKDKAGLQKGTLYLLAIFTFKLHIYNVRFQLDDVTSGSGHWPRAILL